MSGANEVYDNTTSSEKAKRLFKEWHPMRSGVCTCHGPWWVYIPAGQTMALTCPMHGDFDVRSGEAFL